ncbi:hypothetical protein [Sphingomonas sp. AX6]|uniref:hypothetical protein n=1 Tax=Sphingomonas sp. AX6 TaxID=2653171 RepID=UPI0012F2EB2D|nr:hypothetical protein [Sphingomonas sp. AX6]VXC47735.1 conserved hypothetical protein [Sphingomonas sp. AX6]
MDIDSFSRFAALRPDWHFTPSLPNWRVRATRLYCRFRGRIGAPAHRVLTPPVETGDWTIYFAFLPDGQVQPAHRFAIRALKALGRRLMIVCATQEPNAIPAGIRDAADALIWKALPGFDFSAYGIGLRTLATHCPGSDALVLNDSTFGPLTDLTPWLARAQWDLTGFTATSNVENHIQSYAFHLRDVTPRRMKALSAIFPATHSYDRFWSVVLRQETRFARIAARTMSVGAFLFADHDDVEDPTWQMALPLVEAGFPFLKRSLLGKLEHVAPREQTLATLAAAGYPVEEEIAPRA